MRTGNTHTVRIIAATFGYPNADKDVLNGFSAEAVGGDVVWIIGANGSGKSTLAKLLTAQLAPRSGHILVDDKAPTDIPTAERWKHVCLVQQRTYLGFVKATIREELRTALRKTHETRDRYFLATVLEKGHLTNVGTRNPLELSYTEAWRAALAVNYLLKPGTLFIDELPNLCSRYIIEFLEFVVSNRRDDGLITMISVHSQPPAEITKTKSITL